MVTEARRRAWTKYNRSKKRKVCRRRYYELHKKQELRWNKLWEERNPERVKESHKKYRQSPQGKLRDKRYQEFIRLNFPLKLKAKDAANNALKRGKLKRKTRCEECNKKKFLHKHHPDYTKPLEVRWLCVRCHSKLRGR